MTNLPYDIARCLGSRCAIRDLCLRQKAVWTTPPDVLATYIDVFPQPKTESDTCQYQIPLTPSN